jgi:hypothetical protein
MKIKRFMRKSEKMGNQEKEQIRKAGKQEIYFHSLMTRAPFSPALRLI